MTAIKKLWSSESTVAMNNPSKMGKIYVKEYKVQYEYAQIWPKGQRTYWKPLVWQVQLKKDLVNFNQNQNNTLWGLSRRLCPKLV